MKKLTALILAAVMVFALCACSGGGEKNNDSNTPVAYKADYGELCFASGDVKFGIMDPADEVLSALGEPDSSFESNSCAYQGKDKYYYYDGFEILVNDVDGIERITGITVADDTVQTPQGVKIGMKIDEALKLMDGFEYTQSGDTYKFTVGSTVFSLKAGEDGTISAADYTAAVSGK